jgi:hypothetical protein
MNIRYRDRGFVYAIFVLFIWGSFSLHIFAYSRKKSEVLFPEREYVKKHSLVFFKKVNIEHPAIPRVAFFTRSDAYLSAYLYLTTYITKNAFFKEMLPSFQQENLQYIEAFNRNKQKLKIENYLDIQKELKMNNLKFYLSILYTLFTDHQKNKLSGNDAFKLWNILLAITESAYKGKPKTGENAEVLKISAHFVFFKKYKKWQKKGVK